MIKVIFECLENQNEYQEEFEIEDNVTDAGIEKEYKEWVWNQIGERFCWHRE